MTGSQTRFHYRVGRNRDVQGPIALRELEELFRKGVLPSNTQVRREGKSAWVRIGRFVDVAHSEPQEQAVPSIEDMSRLMNEFRIVSEDEGTSQPAAEVPMWSCRVLGTELGPLDFRLLREMAELGELSPTDRVRREPEPKWLLADSIPGLFDGIARTTPDVSRSQAGRGISPQRLGTTPPTSAAPSSVTSVAAGKNPPPPKPAPTSGREHAAGNGAPSSAARSEPPAPRSTGSGSALPPASVSAAAPAAAGHSRPVFPKAAASVFGTTRPAVARPAKRTSPADRSRSFAMPDFRDWLPGPVTLGVMAAVAVCGLAWYFEIFSAGFDGVAGLFSSSTDAPQVQPAHRR